MSALQLVDVETARQARGLRLVILANVPSPWSQAAKTILDFKQLPGLVAIKSSRDTATQAWTGVPNAPVAVYDDEPPRSGWAEILELAERLAPEPSLVPRDPEQRIAMYGLSHELLGAGGLVWSVRLAAIETSLSTEGAQGFMLPAAQYLGARYGYTSGCGAAARKRAIEILGVLRDQLQKAKRAGHEYYLGNTPTALDIYSAASMNALAMLPPEQCAVHPKLRPGFEQLGTEVREALAPELLEHRDRVVAKHFKLPLQL
jgi:glutathione S-transferase